MSLRLCYLREWFDPSSRVIEFVPFDPEATARRFLPEWFQPGAAWAYWTRNGEAMDDDGLDLPLRDEDSILFAIRPGAITVPAASFLGQILTAAAPFVNALTATFALNALQSAFAREPTRPSDQESTTYSFINLQTNQRQVGSPIPVIYGEHRVAAPVINQYVRNYLDGNGDPFSQVLMMFLLCEGPVEQIGDKTADGDGFSVESSNQVDGLQIENQLATNYGGVESSVRMGSNNQEPIPGFEDAIEQASVGQTLRESDIEPPEDVAASAGTYTQADAEITKWDTHVGYTMGETADRFTVVVTFPFGLYDSAQGNPVNEDARFQIRYVPVDSGGTPIVGAEYVVLPEEPTVTAAIVSPFSIEYTHSFRDWNDYVPPTIGFFCDFPTSANTLEKAPSYTVDSTNLPSQSITTTEMSAVLWVKSIDSGTTADGLTQTMFDWYDSGNTQGFRFEMTHSTAGSGFDTFRVIAGSGSAQNTVTFSLGGTIQDDGFSKDTANWHLVGITYKADTEGLGNNRWRVYLDGVMLEELIDLKRGIFDYGQAIHIGGQPDVLPSTNRAYFDFDDVAFYSRELTPFEMGAKWNNGDGVPGDGDEDGLIIHCGWNQETANGGQNYITNSTLLGPGVDSTLSSTGWLVGDDPPGADDAQISLTLGHVLQPETGTKVNDRFLIEVQRTTEEAGRSTGADQSDWSIVQLVTDEDFEYPGMALGAVTIQATDQLSNSTPLVTWLVRGRQVPVWDGADPDNPNAPLTWSRNPAWIAADILTNDVYGLGAFYELSDLDLPAFDAFANWCDDLIEDNQDEVLLTPGSSVVSQVATTGSYTNGYYLIQIDLDEVTDSQLPPNFPGPTSGYTDTGKYINVTGTGISPSVPAWLSTMQGAGPYLIREIIYDTVTNLVDIRAEAPSSATNSAYNPTSGTLAATIFETRMQFDGVFDRQDFPAWDSVLRVLGSARAVPVQNGSKISVFYDDTRSSVAFFGMGNIIQGSYTQDFSGVSDRPNAESAEFYDRDSNFERTFAELEHSDLNDPSLFASFRWKRISLEGITRRSQVLRHLHRDLNGLNLLRRFITMDLGLDSFPLKPGDVFDLAHDVPGFGESGRVWENSGSLTQIKLDRDVTLEAATSYEITIRFNATGVIETVGVDEATTGLGTKTAGTAITMAASFSALPQKDDIYSWGIVAASVKQFSVVESKIDAANLTRKIRAIEYDANAYSDDFENVAASISNLDPPTADAQIPQAPEGAAVTEGAGVGPDGSGAIIANVSFIHNPATRVAVAGTEVYVSEVEKARGQLVKTLDAHTTHFAIKEYPFREDATYWITLKPINRRGAGPLHRLGARIKFSPVGLTQDPVEPGAVTAKVSGFEALYDFTDSEKLGKAREIELRSGGWILGRKMFSVPGGSRAHGPTRDWVGVPGGTLNLSPQTVLARARYPNGMYSDGRQVTPDFDAVGTMGNAYNRIEEDSSWPGTQTGLDDTIAYDAEDPVGGGTGNTMLGASGAGLTHTYEFSPTALAGPQDLFIQITVDAYQIHPITIAEAGKLGTFNSPNVQRWTTEGPLVVRPGETDNCTLKIEIAHSTTATPGTDFREYTPGVYRARSFTVKVTITRPDTTYDFRVRRIATRATQVGGILVDNAFPGTPLPGQIVPRTDHDEASFLYDTTRGRWLGLDTFVLEGFFSGSQTTGYLDQYDGTAFSSTSGWVAPFDCICTGLTAVVDPSSSPTYRVRDDGSDVTGAQIALSSETSKTVFNVNSNLIAAGSIVSIHHTSGSVSTRQHVTAYFKRFET